MHTYREANYKLWRCLNFVSLDNIILYALKLTKGNQLMLCKATFRLTLFPTELCEEPACYKPCLNFIFTQFWIKILGFRAENHSHVITQLNKHKRSIVLLVGKIEEKLLAYLFMTSFIGNLTPNMLNTKILRRTSSKMWEDITYKCVSVPCGITIIPKL